MQVWNVLNAARCKYRTQKSRQKSPSGHHRTTSSGYIFAIKARIDNRKKMLSSNISPPHVFIIWWTLAHYGWERFVSLGHPCKFQRVSCLGNVTARHSSSERQPNFVALNRARHLYSAGRPSRWALAHISSTCLFQYWIWNGTFLPHGVVRMVVSLRTLNIHWQTGSTSNVGLCMYVLSLS